MFWTLYFTKKLIKNISVIELIKALYYNIPDRT